MKFNEETKEKSLQYAKKTCQKLIDQIEEQQSKNNLTTKEEVIAFINDYYEQPQNKYDIKEAYIYVKQPIIINRLNTCFEELNDKINNLNIYIDSLGLETTGLSILSNELNELADYSIQNKADKHFIGAIKHEFQNYILEELGYTIENTCKQPINIEFEEPQNLQKIKIKTPLDPETKKFFQELDMAKEPKGMKM